jgi:hypothetical protein
MLQTTTLKSYRQNIEPKLGSLRFQIIRLLKAYPAGLTNKEMSRMLEKDASTISGIVGPMAKENLVIQGPERPCRVTGNTVMTWKLKEEPPASKPENQPASLF